MELWLEISACIAVAVLLLALLTRFPIVSYLLGGVMLLVLLLAMFAWAITVRGIEKLVELIEDHSKDKHK